VIFEENIFKGKNLIKIAIHNFEKNVIKVFAKIPWRPSKHGGNRFPL